MFEQIGLKFKLRQESQRRNQTYVPRLISCIVIGLTFVIQVMQIMFLSLQEYFALYIKIYDTCFPLYPVTKSSNSCKQPWMTPVILESCQTNNKLLRAYLKDPTHCSEFFVICWWCCCIYNRSHWQSFSTLNDEFVIIHKCFIVSRLSLNFKKSNFVLFHTPRKNSSFVLHPTADNILSNRVTLLTFEQPIDRRFAFGSLQSYSYLWSIQWSFRWYVLIFVWIANFNHYVSTKFIRRHKYEVRENLFEVKNVSGDFCDVNNVSKKMLHFS